jgi:hypothetical protein
MSGTSQLCHCTSGEYTEEDPNGTSVHLYLFYNNSMSRNVVNATVGNTPQMTVPRGEHSDLENMQLFCRILCPRVWCICFLLHN